MPKTEEKKYNFGEKSKEFIEGKTLLVTLHTPKYNEAKTKAIELIESTKYKGILLESDFWILVNTHKNKTEAMYSGLIISHDGCLKINDALDSKSKFRPECVSIDKDGYNDSLVFKYECAEQGLYEVGEVSSKNCKNNYPYAMALKRCFDRVVLKNSKIAYSGIYSDSESDEFAKREEPLETSKTPSKVTNTSSKGKKMSKKVEELKQEESNPETTEQEKINYRDKLIAYCKENGLDMKDIAVTYRLTGKSKDEEFRIVLDTLESAMSADIGERLGENN